MAYPPEPQPSARMVTFTAMENHRRFLAGEITAQEYSRLDARPVVEPVWGDRAELPGPPSVRQRLRAWVRAVVRDRLPGPERACDRCGRRIDWPGAQPCSRCYFELAASALVESPRPQPCACSAARPPPTPRPSNGQRYTP